MKSHPYADVLPLLEGEAFDALVADIRANGLLEPITIHEGMILDGRNRYRACEAAGIEPKFLKFDGDDPLAFVLSLNLHRRHLDESQRAMVVARLETLKHGGDRKGDQDANLHLDRRALASRLNVSTRTAASAAAVRDHATPELIRAVDRGDIAVSVAAGLATAPVAIQQRAVADPKRAHVLAKQAARAERETELGAKQLAWPTKICGVIYADPPWPWTSYNQVTGMDRAPTYPTMEIDAIKALKVQSIAAPDSVLFLWATVPTHMQAGEVMAAWGFSYQTQFVWLKKIREGEKNRPGTGYWSRNVHETLLVGTRGKIPAPAPGTQQDSVIDAPVGEHSAKPEVFAEMIERHFPTLPKIELFARKAREGWARWGFEAPID
jgi:N6-adenosine-specific RNA methylase IME4/ParB-like chromosome segregation protein Spo0J